MYILGKLFMWLAAPMSQISFFLVLAFILRRRWIGKRLVYVAVFLFWFYSNPFFSNVFLRAWEVKPRSIATIQQPYHSALLFGGMLSMMEPRDRPHLSQSGDRALQTYLLYRYGKVKNIIVTAGCDSLFSQFEPEPFVLSRWYYVGGVPTRNYWVEIKALNTWENAFNCKRLLVNRGVDIQKERFLLVTSASHMPRAAFFLSKTGLHFDCWSADYRSNIARFWNLESWLIPSATSLDTWKLLIKEWIGIQAYRLKNQPNE